MPSYLPIFVAFAMTIAGLILLKPLAIRLNLVDKPGGRKLHEGDIPLIGGIAMFFGFAFSLLTLHVSLSTYRCLIAGCVLLVITGVLDDFHELGPRARLFIQLFVAILMITWGNNYLNDLGNLFHYGTVHLKYFGYPVTIIAVLAVINAVNMTDGADGLAGTIGLIELIYLAWMAFRVNQYIDMQILVLLIAVVLGFLCFNFPLRQQARVFMGDSGSMLLGFVLVWFCVDLSQTAGASHPVTFLWILAVPLWDISCVVIRRLLRGYSPLKADRGHLHHYLLEKGFSSLQVTSLIGALSAVLGLIGVLGENLHIPESFMFGGFIGLFALYLWILHRAWTRLALTV
ncbi:MAG TPA: MraY family glycosyltransferase [Gammaproteobacteria bacterium]|nr:MraY family glycosyltransferase [Gammaproteobacteria bacterium]